MAAIGSIAEKIDCPHEALRRWVRQAERDQGRRPGLTTDERQQLKALQREVGELRRASDILREGVRVLCPGGAEIDRAWHEQEAVDGADMVWRPLRLENLTPRAARSHG